MAFIFLPFISILFNHMTIDIYRKGMTLFYGVYLVVNIAWNDIYVILCPVFLLETKNKMQENT